MLLLSTLPDGYAKTRREVQRVATHVLARGLAATGGRIGLRVTPGGVGTPAFGAAQEVLRLTHTSLVRERQGGDGPRTDTLSIAGRTLGELAALGGLDLSSSFSVGRDTPPLGDPTSPIEFDSDAVEALIGWLQLGDLVLNEVLPSTSSPSVIQVWPEHFDIALDVASRSGRVNLGASPGDAHHPDPYLYVGPWGAERPGDPDYWNAPFGAVLGHGNLLGSRAPVADAASFMLRGLDLLR